MNETFICSICGHEYPKEDGVPLGHRNLCPSCLAEHTVTCRECGTLLLDTDNSGTEDYPLCQDCYDDRYTNCAQCGALLRLSDACYSSDDPGEENPYCNLCYDAREREVIHDYYYKPSPIFYGQGPRYFGVELEIDEAGENRAKARAILNILNRDNPLAYCKHDGSLDDGFEIVSHPMSLDCHLQRMPWQEAMAKAVHMGYTSHQAGTCGLHVHVSRAAFGESEIQQDAAMARILYFFEKHWEELLKFSRRTQRQLDRWAARYGYRDRPQDILAHAKKGHSDRYTCVNLTNWDTIEFRIFRGTLKYNTFVATLQMIDRICDAAIFLSDDELTALSWTTFVSSCTQPELIQYLKERRLYVNEPVVGEGEI